MLAELLSQLHEQRGNVTNSTIGLTAAMELSWNSLDEFTQQIGMLLSLFAPTPIPQTMLERVADAALVTDTKPEVIATACNAFVQRHLLQHIDTTTYRLHTSIRSYLQIQLDQSPQSDRFKQAFAQVMVSFAQRLSDPPPVEECSAFALAVPHIAEAATTWQAWLADESIVFPYFCLGRFYAAQGALEQSAHWYKQCLLAAQNRLDREHLAISVSLTHLANAYYAQRCYQEAEPLYKQALQLLQQSLGEKHLAIATTLTNLANLYKSQGRYCEAEPLYAQALALRQQLLDEAHPDIALSLNNLAGLYASQERYLEAEPLYAQALEIADRRLEEQLGPQPAFLESFQKTFQTPNFLWSEYESSHRFLAERMIVAEDLVREWQFQLAIDLPGYSSVTRESIVKWLLDEVPSHYDNLTPSLRQITAQVPDYRYRILCQRYLDLSPERAYRNLIQRLNSLFPIRNKIRILIALSRDRQQSVVDVLEEVVQELLKNDTYMQQQILRISQCTQESNLRNALLLASTEEYCLRPIRNQPLLSYRFANYLRRREQGGMTQVPVEDIIRLVSEDFGSDDSDGLDNLLYAQAIAQYQDTHVVEEQEELREAVQKQFETYLLDKLGPEAAQWLRLYLQGLSQEEIAQSLNMPVKQVYKLREKINYHVIKVFASKTQQELVAWLGSPTEG